MDFLIFWQKSATADLLSCCHPEKKNDPAEAQPSRVRVRSLKRSPLYSNSSSAPV